MTEKKNKSAIQRRLIPTYIFLIIVSFISVFPLYWMISAATNTTTDVSRGRILPGTYFMENFKNLTAQQPLWRALGNSLFYAVLTTVLCLLICSIAGYGFEVYHDRWKDRLFSILLLAMMVPQVATMVPLFKMFSKAGLLNTAVGFILPILSTPFMIMMFRQNARAFPIDIHECMECLSVAEGNHDRQQGVDYADADRQFDHRICDRLRYADVRRIILFYSDYDRILRITETVRRRYYRSC